MQNTDKSIYRQKPIEESNYFYTLSPYTLEVFLFPLSIHIGGILVSSLPTHWRYTCCLSPYTLEVFLFPLSLHIRGILVSSLPTHWRYTCFLSPYTLEVYLFPLSLHIGGILVSSLPTYWRYTCFAIFVARSYFCTNFQIDNLHQLVIQYGLHLYSLHICFLFVYLLT